MKETHFLMALFRVGISLGAIFLLSQCGDNDDDATTASSSSAASSATTTQDSATTVDISEGSLAGTTLNIEVGGVAEGSTVQVAATETTPADFTSVTSNPVSASGVLNVSATDSSGNAINTAQTPMTLNIPVTSTSLTLAEAKEENLCAFLDPSDESSKPVVWRNDALTIKDDVVTVKSKTFGVYQLYYCGTDDLPGFMAGDAEGNIHDIYGLYTFTANPAASVPGFAYIDKNGWAIQFQDTLDSNGDNDCGLDKSVATNNAGTELSKFTFDADTNKFTPDNQFDNNACVGFHSASDGNRSFKIFPDTNGIRLGDTFADGSTATRVDTTDSSSIIGAWYFSSASQPITSLTDYAALIFLSSTQAFFAVNPSASNDCAINGGEIFNYTSTSSEITLVSNPFEGNGCHGLNNPSDTYPKAAASYSIGTDGTLSFSELTWKRVTFN